MFSVDGIAWPFPCRITRISRVEPSEISGLLMDGSYFNDVLGQYLRYDIALAVPANRRDAYARLYEALTEPVDGHAFVLPYNGGTVRVTGRVEDVRDDFLPLPDGGGLWTATRFTVAANHPTRAQTLAGALSRGRSPLPEVAEAREGDSYTFVDGQWVVMAQYRDADEVGY